MIKAIIFDFDGVILESLNTKTKAFEKLYEPYGSTVSKKVVKHHLENGGISRFDKIKFYHKNYLDEIINDKKVKKLANNFSKLVLNEIIQVPFVDGAKQFIKNNYQRYLMFISSATPIDELNFICRKRMISSYFKGIYGSPDSKSKHITSIIKNWSLNNNEMIFIGDSLSDLNAAEAHNLTFIGRLTNITNNFVNQKFKLNDLTELDEIISTIV